jgi:hypothetical protein
VNIVIYADDSGTHSLIAKEKGSNIAVLAGYAGFADDWVNFCGRWQTTLNEYKVKIFHFSEFADKKNKSKDSKWPYFGWPDEKRHEFLFKLASIAGSRARFPVAASFHLADYHADPNIKAELKAKGLNNEQINGAHLVYSGLFADIYDAFFKELKFHHPDFDGSLSFIFDTKQGDAYWEVAANGVSKIHEKSNSKLVAPGFGNTFTDVPLQAADMIAYRLRQVWENERKKKGKVPAVLDISCFAALDYALWGNFKGRDDFRDHMQHLLIRNAKNTQIKSEQNARRVWFLRSARS